MTWLCLIPFLLQSSPDYYALDAQTFFARPEVQEAIDPMNFHKELMDAALYHASNEARQQANQPPLEHHAALQASSNLHSQAMRQKGFFNHRNPYSRRYRSASKRIAAFNPKFNGSAENIAEVHLRELLPKGDFYVEDGQVTDGRGQPLPFRTYADLAQIVVAQWMDSPGHRENLLGAYQYLACASSLPYRRKKRDLYQISITQNFGRHD